MQAVVKIWTQLGQNVVKIWSGYGQKYDFTLSRNAQTWKVIQVQQNSFLSNIPLGLE